MTIFTLPDPPVHPLPPMWIGFSGGLDSAVLLHYLATSQHYSAASIQAVHIHHGLSPQADAWVAHCQKFCSDLSIPFRHRVVDVSRDSRTGLEAAARHARYRAFAEIMDANDILVTAHQQDDQAETFLLRALRASGPDGLAAMRPWRRFARGWHWRPLLRVSRATLQRYAEFHQLNWIDDPSNENDAFDRNFLRHQIFPLLHTRWPQATSAFARSAQLSADAADMLANEDTQWFERAQTDSAYVLSLSALHALRPARRARIIRCWLQRIGFPRIPASGLEAVEKALIHSREDAQAEFAWAGVKLRRWRDRLYAMANCASWPSGWSKTWDGRRPLALPDGSQLALHALRCTDTPVDIAFPEAVTVHTRRGGERIKLPNRPHSHSLKALLQQSSIPPWQRQHIPLLSSIEGELLAAGDMFISARLLHWLNAHHLTLRWKTAETLDH